MIVGITGGIGSGKSCASLILKKYGFVVIDADKLAREVVKKGSPTLKKLSDTFGEEILCKCGRLNRKKLASLCFENDRNYQKLNKITGKAIKDLAISKIEKNKGKDIAFEVILLFESGWDTMCNKTVAVCADTDTRIKRVIKRDNCSREDAIARINRQMSDKEYKKLADIVVYNNGSLKQLEKELVSHLGIKKG